MSALLKKFVASLTRDGAVPTAKKVLAWGMRQFGPPKTDPVRNRRIEISNQLAELFDSKVKYGPFCGLELPKESWWGNAARSSMLLGLYEQEVLQSLTMIPRGYDTFIELGAGDGYYAIGVLISGLFRHSICHESTEAGRRVIALNAERNGVTDRIEIRGIANRDFYSQIPVVVIAKSVLFIDIEGAEFELLESSTFRAFSKSIIFVELHDWFYEDGDEKLRKLRSDARATHTATELTMTSRDLSKFEELRKFNDNDRWLICSEGRGQLMTWLRFDPIQVTHSYQQLEALPNSAALSKELTKK